MSAEDVHAHLESEVAKVFAANPSLPDHRQSAPWATGSLGNPDADVWFIAEYLCDIPHISLLTPAMEKNLTRVDRRTLRGEMLGHRKK